LLNPERLTLVILEFTQQLVYSIHYEMGKQNENNQHLIEQIKIWKKKRNALIIAHNYQIPDIQDIADYVGDSLGLSQQAAAAKENLMIYCGVILWQKALRFFPRKKQY